MVAIIYTTFLRDSLMNLTIDSIMTHWSDNYVLLVGDQGATASKSLQFGARKDFSARGEYIPLPYDCGLSEARNRLISRAWTLGCEYSLITADSIAFSYFTDVSMAMDFLEVSPRFGILGFHLEGRIPWEHRLNIKSKDEDRFFEFSPAGDMYIDPDTRLPIVECDICRNFFLARTETLMVVKWDPKLKLSEHEDFFWRYKQAGYGVAWTPGVSGQYIESRPAAYLKYRKRCDREFRDMLLKKYDLTQWAKVIW